MSWPSTIPHDLATKLAELDRQRSLPTDADRWDAIKEWLEEHGVSAPKKLPNAPEIPAAD